MILATTRGSEILKRRKPDTTYLIQVRAKRWGGKTSEWSVPVRVTTPAAPGFAAPVITAKPFFILNQIVISWTDVGFWRGRWDLEYYQVYRTTSPYVTITDIIANGTLVEETRARVFTDHGYDATNYPQGPRQNVNYYYYVRGIGREGLLGDVSTYDPAELGKPDNPVIFNFSDDPTANFLFYKGWKMQWYVPNGCEGFWVRYRDTAGLALWTLKIWVPFIANTTKQAGWDVQEHTFPFLTVGREYQFEVTAINNTVVTDLWSSAISADSTVIDQTDPDPPTTGSILQGPISNWISWAFSPSTDVRHYRVYRNLTGTTPNQVTGAEVRGTVPHTTNFFIDTFAGVMDNKNWHYWVDAVDWNDNYSSLLGELVEEDALSAPTLVAPVSGILGSLWLNWAPVTGASYYKVYRNTVNTFATATLINSWCLTTFHVDLFAAWGGTWYYWVVTVSASGISSSESSSVNGVPTKPGSQDDVYNTGEIPNYGGGGPVVSTGDFEITGNGSLVMGSSGDIVWTSVATIHSQVAGQLWTPVSDASIGLYFGNASYQWERFWLYASDDIRIYGADIEIGNPGAEVVLWCSDLGFFGTGSASQQTVSGTASGTDATIINALLTALKAYNLIT